MAQVHSVDPRKLADRLKYGPEVASYAAAAATAALLRTKVVIVEAQPRAGARLARTRSAPPPERVGPGQHAQRRSGARRMPAPA